MFTLLLSLCLAAVPVDLPASEDPAAWERAAELHDVELRLADSGPRARVQAVQAVWTVTVFAADGHAHAFATTPARDEAAREDLLASIVALTEASDPAPLTLPAPSTPPAPPPPAPPTLQAQPPPAVAPPGPAPLGPLPSEADPSDDALAREQVVTPVARWRPQVRLGAGVHTRSGATATPRAALAAGFLRGNLGLSLLATASGPTRLLALGPDRSFRQADLLAEVARDGDGPYLAVNGGLTWRRWSDPQGKVADAVSPLVGLSAGWTLPATRRLSARAAAYTQVDLVVTELSIAGAGDLTLPPLTYGLTVELCFRPDATKE